MPAKTGTTRSRTSKARSKKAPAAEVLEVRPTRAISWPDETFRGRGARREITGYDKAGKAIYGMSEPYRVLSTDPFIDGQRHNLQPAPEGSEAVPTTEWPRKWAKRATELGGAIMDKRSRREIGTDALVQDVDDSQIPEPDLGDDLDADLEALG